jgi:hypothetical protein
MTSTIKNTLAVLALAVLLAGPQAASAAEVTGTLNSSASTPTGSVTGTVGGGGSSVSGSIGGTSGSGITGTVTGGSSGGGGGGGGSGGNGPPVGGTGGSEQGAVLGAATGPVAQADPGTPGVPDTGVGDMSPGTILLLLVAAVFVVAGTRILYKGGLS